MQESALNEQVVCTAACLPPTMLYAGARYGLRVDCFQYVMLWTANMSLTDACLFRLPHGLNLHF